MTSLPKDYVRNIIILHSVYGIQSQKDGWISAAGVHYINDEQKVLIPWHWIEKIVYDDPRTG